MNRVISMCYLATVTPMAGAPMQGVMFNFTDGTNQFVAMSQMDHEGLITFIKWCVSQSTMTGHFGAVLANITNVKFEGAAPWIES